MYETRLFPTLSLTSFQFLQRLFAFSQYNHNINEYKRAERI